MGFVLLIKGAHSLVTGASSLARRFNVSELIIGLTIVALGTSAPELVVNIISGVEGHDEVVFGNIIGSNIFNLFLILGVAGVIYPLKVQRDTVLKEVPFSLLATLILFFLVNDQMFGRGISDGSSLIDGIVLLLLFLVFLGYIFISMKKNMLEEKPKEVAIISNNWGITLRIAGGLLGLALGGKLVVDNAVSVAELYGVSQKLIGLTIVAAGTSLPELATSAVAAYNRKADIAIGNIVGSNIFNLLLVLGISTIISPLEYNTELNTDLYILLAGTIMLLLFMFTINTKRLDRWESMIYLMSFCAYMVFLFIRQ